ncbi:hypothetical protein F5B22DRAFT_616627 [Xylaria bambusicola]|uniref:uncharacterized protein n=1 Tax=Xylaria bambusicola TaxID=326684 RepID=UPI002008D108|nr:uncharacterized protein F5B22DRAFT_616627 [Xylaria bambusicola]KAI0509532.1 hypothetical protein F5B22DRAFT_616627 [Xylaria bambusicola]
MSPPLTKNARENYVASVTLIVLTSVCVLLRLSLKIFRGQSPRGPDLLCFVAMGVFGTYAALILNFIFNVSQYRALDPDPRLGVDEAMNLAKLVYTNELLFGAGITAIKLSILWFYHDLFSVDMTLLRVIRVTAGICILWFVVATLVIALQCSPVQAYWEHYDLPPYCLEYPRVLLGYEISNLFIDVAILCIPTGTIIRLNLSWLRKVPIISIFLLGAVVCIFSIVRLTAIWNPPDIFTGLNFGATYIWSTAQLGVAIITSCLPTFGPLLSFFAKPVPYIRSLYEALRSFSSINRSSARNKVMGAVGDEGSWGRVADDRGTSPQSWTHAVDLDTTQFALHAVPSRAALVDRGVDAV